MRLVTLNLPQALLNGLDDAVRKGHYPNRSEAIRQAIRDLLTDEVWVCTPNKCVEKVKANGFSDRV